MPAGCGARAPQWNQTGGAQRIPRKAPGGASDLRLRHPHGLNLLAGLEGHDHGDQADDDEAEDHDEGGVKLPVAS